MANNRLELDDIALLRALDAMGPACSRKLKLLVEKFQLVLEATGVGFREVKNTSSFFDRMDRPQYAIDGKCCQGAPYLKVSAGIVGDDVRVWIGYFGKDASSGAKKATRDLLQVRKAALLEKNDAWVVTDPDEPSEEAAFITKPLISVLGLADWEAPLVEFVQCAINDLHQLDILEQLVLIGAMDE